MNHIREQIELLNWDESHLSTGDMAVCNGNQAEGKKGERWEVGGKGIRENKLEALTIDTSTASRRRQQKTPFPIPLQESFNISLVLYILLSTALR